MLLASGDHNDLGAPWNIRETLRKPHSRILRSPPAIDFGSRTTGQQFRTRQKARWDEQHVHFRTYFQHSRPLDPRSSKPQKQRLHELSGATGFPDVPFPPAISASHAITIQGFLTTLTLPREKVVTVQEPYNRAQPPSRLSLLIGFRCFSLFFLLSFQVCPGPCTFETIHERLDLSLRSPRNLTLLDVVIGVVVPTSFPPNCRGHYPCRPVESPDSLTTSPTLSLHPEAR
ncbi:hypothetical protein CRG98_029400 [Punica granatum]|uniref:Uncharacterized protein n=1 Tax=Punica granatum TaxID=22663 RepID=A0A2I0J1V1_PUNGR|nr:hypothetical protein CRG98_029400 [Punica granatum]